MIYAKNRKQKQLIEFYPGLTKHHLNYLKNTIYSSFRENILPNIPVKPFLKYFSPSSGRPTKDIQSVIGLFIIQVILNLTDREAVEAYSFYNTVRFALDISGSEYMCERTYYYYRSKLLTGVSYEVSSYY